MPDFEKLYFQLFAATADAVDAIEHMNFGDARALLIIAQQKCEEEYVAEE